MSDHRHCQAHEVSVLISKQASEITKCVSDIQLIQKQIHEAVVCVVPVAKHQMGLF